MSKSNFSHEYYPYHFCTEAEMLKTLQEFAPAIFAKVVFIRPHHMLQWFLMHYHGYDTQTNTYDQEKFIKRLKKNKLNEAKLEVTNLLAGELIPEFVGSSIEFLQVLRSSTADELSVEDRERLLSLQLTEDMFEELARKESQIFADVWQKDDNTTIVLARVLDNHCTLLHENGSSHCTVYTTLPEYNTDEYYLQAMLRIKHNREVAVEVRDQIDITYVGDTNILQSASFPVSFLRDYSFILTIEETVNDLSDEADRKLQLRAKRKKDN